MADDTHFNRQRIFVDSSWIADSEDVTFEDIVVPTQDLPDPELAQENGNAETLKQQENRWTDLG